MNGLSRCKLLITKIATVIAALGGQGAEFFVIWPGLHSYIASPITFCVSCAMGAAVP